MLEMGASTMVFDYYSALSKVKRHVDQDLARDLSLRDAASVAGLEAKYFSAFFRAKVGVCFKEWLAQHRIDRALSLLADRDLSITQVAFAVGFQDLRTFQRAFKKHTGLPARSYRDTVRQSLRARCPGEESMTANAAQKIDLTLDLAHALAMDDAFRQELVRDPRQALARFGVQVEPGVLPRWPVLPPREICRDRLGVGSKAPRPEDRPERLASREAPAALLVKRPLLCFFRMEDKYFLGLAELLRGELLITRNLRILAANPLTGDEQPVTLEELQVLRGVPATRWLPVEVLRTRTEADERTLDGLIAKRLLLTNRAEPEAAELRRRDGRIGGDRWEPYAALYHFMARWRDMGLSAASPDWWERARDSSPAFRRRLAQLGPSPSPFHEIAGAPSIALPWNAEPDDRFRPLSERRTSRVFRRGGVLGQKDLVTLLQQVFGCQGTTEVVEGHTVLHRTSPSGGGLHPIEAYPLLLRVEGIAPGLYHYNVGRHALELLEALTVAEAEELVRQGTAGQTYFATAPAVFILTARFYRTFWKYPDHKKAYKVLLMDAAHLSQTFYTACTILGLGVFFTAAINEGNLEERLRLDGFAEAPVGICGCGIPEEGSGLELEARPWRPERA